ncbi:di-trans,poly-cis-decaprenylcistransferase [Granulicella sp. 5B5]|uniref:polyprenyl diphosphate synthase n=1 Tax=Granulicella sp. 5B5 TaxID=1617967 RepID=UPI0015F72AE5|nr:polyprenyl diphosphate synthase [Granulicella sp. 5B5]QMV18094.1 di-trans,poly-cis-decaprenylcistransferase [Granulicella sp. 5B5]
MRETNPIRGYQRSNRAHELTADERALYDTLDLERMPQHVAVIMDGNGRWAGKRALKRFLGHQQGAESVQYVVETASRINLPWLTLYAFSIENNLRRPGNEVSFLMKLLKSYLISNVKRMNDNNIRMAYIGSTHELPAEVQDTMQWAAEQTAKNTGTTLTLALNYGSRSEIVDSARSILRKLLAEARQRGISVEDMLAAEGGDLALEHRIDEDQISANLYTAHMPDPDLLIRTSGEQRISNFLLWQIAYAEIFVTDRLWPDFRGLHLLEAIADYQHRERRFGGLGESTDEDLADTLPTEAALARH